MSFFAEALFSESMLESIRESQQIEKKKRLCWSSIACAGACVFFLSGFFGGLFSPREAVSESLTFRSRKWLDESCTVLDASRCPDGYSQSNPPLLVISFDGFRAEYLTRNLTRALEKIRKCGVQAESLRPTYPSITFPNHYSIATGLNAESHGIVDKLFYDPKLNRNFDYRLANNTRESVWWKGEPIWVSARKQGKRAHTYFWVGSEAEIQGYRPNEFRTYDEEQSFEGRVDTVLDWLSAPKNARPDITMLYFDEPDTASSRYKTHSPGLELVLKRVDKALERLMQGLLERDLLDCVNVIVLSDHGMADLNCKENIALSPILQQHNSVPKISSQDFEFMGGIQGRLNVTSNSNIALEQLFESVAVCPTGKKELTPRPYQVYRKEDLPRRLHYSNSERLDPVVILVKEGLQIFKSGNPKANCVGSSHGYDNLYLNMQGIFLAQGPSFKTGLTVKPFLNIEIYNLMCDLLGIVPAPNNGTFGSLHQLLRNPRPYSGEKPRTDISMIHFPNADMRVFGQEGYCSPKCRQSSEEIAKEESKLNISRQFANNFQRTLAPRGVPETAKDFKTRLLINRDLVISFSEALKLPMWASFLINSNTTVNDFFFAADDHCIRRDPRLDNNSTLACDDLSSDSTNELALTLLISPEMLGKSGYSDALILPNIVPMYREFRSGIWTTFWKTLSSWASDKSTLDAQLGPIFDHTAPRDEKRPYLPIPSHFFAVITRKNHSEFCVIEPCLSSVMAFILPHDKNPFPACQDELRHILTHSARVRDVELASGLRFFTGSPVYERIQLLTQLPTHLWHQPTGF